MLTVGDVTDDRRPFARLRPEVFRHPADVARHHGVGGGQDVLGGPVVLFEQDDLRAGEIAFELGDIAYRGAPERVDRLIRVTNDAKLSWRHEVVTAYVARLAADKLSHQDVLRVVGVLVLIDQDVPELTPPQGGHVGKGLEQVDRDHDDVVEVHRPGGDEPALVLSVRFGQRFLSVSVRARRHGLVVEQLVLERGHLGRHRLRRMVLGVEVKLSADQSHQSLGVGLVVDRKRGWVAESVSLPPQDPNAGRVKGEQPHTARLRPGQRLRSCGHLTRRLVGEGDREYLRRRRIPLSH